MKRRTQSGFSLIEMMVVMVIISVLVGLLLPILAKVRSNGRITATTAFMGNIKNAVRLYEFEWGQFPPDGIAGGVTTTVTARKPGNGSPGTYLAKSSSALYYFLCTPFHTTLNAVSAGRGEVLASKDLGPYLDCPPIRKKNITSGTFSGSVEILDDWGNALQYDCLRSDAYDAVSSNGSGAVEIREDGNLVKTPGTTGQNPTSFDLWSYGEGYAGSAATCTRPIANFKLKGE